MVLHGNAAIAMTELQTEDITPSASKVTSAVSSTDR
jgi:hypothetical protein